MSVLPIVNRVQSKEIVKVAIQKEGKIPQLIELNQKKPTSEIIEEICSNWDIKDCAKYCLEFSENSNSIFVHDKNRNEIINGTILSLQSSPARISEDVIKILKEYLCDQNVPTLSISSTNMTSTNTKGIYQGTLASKLGIMTNYYHIITNTNNNVNKNLSLAGLNNDNERYSTLNHQDVVDNLRKFLRLCSDQYFASIYINDYNGLYYLLMALNNVITNGYKSDKDRSFTNLSSFFLLNIKESLKTDLTMCLAMSINEFLQNGLLDWNPETQNLLIKISHFLNNRDILKNPLIIKPFLEIMEYFLINIPGSYDTISQEINMGAFIDLLQINDYRVQIGTLQLINVTLNKALEFKKHEFINELYENIIGDVINKAFIKIKINLNNEVSQQLCILQRFLLSKIETDINTNFDVLEQKHKELLASIKIHVNDYNEIDVVRANSLSNSEALININLINDNCEPMSEILYTLHQPYGYLAIKNMKYYSTNYNANLSKVIYENVLKNNSYGFPIFKTCVYITKILCETLKLGKFINNQEDDIPQYFLMFYTKPYSFCELFIIIFNLFHKTWKEMRASSMEDFNKVCIVIHEQLNRALACNPISFDLLKQKLNELSYSNLNSIWLQERYYKEELESQSPVIKELRDHLKPKIVKLVLENRFYYMESGTIFANYNNKNNRIKDKYTYIQLSSNHKTLLYYVCEENKLCEINLNLVQSVYLKDIASIDCGKDIQQFKDIKNKKALLSLVLIINLKNDLGYINLIAPDIQSLNKWMDGLSFLIGEEIMSHEFKNDLETLLSMEIKVHLLEIQNIVLQDTPPDIPKDPPHYNFISLL
ncbi:unnamed protein product [Gordionus sp. m RMFG-2023]